MATTLQSAVGQLCAAEGLSQDQALLPMCDLAAALARYQEEGVPLFPEILVSLDIGAVVPMLQAQDRMLLGSGPTDGIAAAALKVVAPLCKSDWFGYIQLGAETSEYGVMRRSSSPLSVPLATSLRDCEVPALIFFQSVRGSVEVIGARGGSLLVDFTASRLAPSAPQDALRDLAEAVTRHLPVEDRETSTSFLLKTLTHALREGHGCLLAVVPGANPPLPELFGAGSVVLPTGGCMDIGAAVRACRDLMTVETAAALKNIASLLGGMMGCDGITVLSSSFQVLAYRVFISPKTAALVGGARRRTYQTLCEHIGDDLDAAFIRSQDGHMECARRKP